MSRRRATAAASLLEIEPEPEKAEDEVIEKEEQQEQSVFTERPQQALAAVPRSTPNDPSQLLALAVEKDFDLEKLQKLMELYERWQDRQARAAYYDALTEFQSKVPRISRKKLVTFTTDKGTTSYYYAPLGDIDESIKPTMFECRLSKRWDIQDKDKGEMIFVTCYITHSMGHSEHAEMSAKADFSGGKNAIQQRGSTIQYLQRYTLIGALGISTADDDIDARIGPDADEKVTPEQAAHIKEMLHETNGKEESLLKLMKVGAIADIPLMGYGKAIKAIADRAKKLEEAKLGKS